MTVAELIEDLKQFNPDLPVYLHQFDEYDEDAVVPLEIGHVSKELVRKNSICTKLGIGHEAVII